MPNASGTVTFPKSPFRDHPGSSWQRSQDRPYPIRKPRICPISEFYPEQQLPGEPQEPGAPQQPPDACSTGLRPEAGALWADINLTRFWLPHFVQRSVSSFPNTMNSLTSLHSLQRYSNIGIDPPDLISVRSRPVPGRVRRTRAAE